MDHKEVSIHELKIYLALKEDPSRWLTNAQIVEKIGKIAERTVRMHTARLVSAGLADRAEVFPGHRFRLAQKIDKRGNGYFQRLEKAREVFGL